MTTKQTQKAGSDSKAYNAAAEKMNDAVTRTIDAFGLRPFLLRQTDVFRAIAKEDDEGFGYFHVPHGLQLTAIGDWTDGVTIQFEQGRQSKIPTALVRWSSGGGAARAELIYRAARATDALNLAFDEVRRKVGF